ncbi:LOW QUALITY PROTEIN: Zinc-type alcohol dehydrogenase-like protein [Drechslerella dactyloides]|uniref:Zinc-type alcohol dehydrogenase-like protein n=1 Tax=Drechslerella dactyloides TaxID=74499 RepID=A0AAD6J655_DREDA|nr:LOW QUALITY PROTEIN: Zinc-type alcohol dehydrogenase-like protein [Drechslerella dactyloides]
MEHEYMGIVESVGKNVTKVKPGDRVVASFQISCGTCRFCSQKLSSQCERTNDSSIANAMYGHRTAGVLGYSHFAGGYAGGQAEFVRAPFADVNLLVVPEGVSDERALFLSDVLPTSYHCVVDTGVYPGDTVGIWGMGPIGLFAAKWAFLKGAKRVIAIDSVPWRLSYAASKIPNIETLNFSTVKSVPGALKEMAPGGLDVALECAAGEYPKSMLHKVEIAVGLETDSADVLNEMISSVRPFGRIGITGLYTGFVNHLNIGAIMQTGIRFIGNGQAPVLKYWQEILNDYIIPGKIDPNMMISHRIPLNEMAELYAKFDARDEKDGLMKPAQPQVHVRAPPKETLNLQIATEELRVAAAKPHPEPKPSNRARLHVVHGTAQRLHPHHPRAASAARPTSAIVVPSSAAERIGRVEGREAVGEDEGQVLRRDSAAAVTDPNRDGAGRLGFHHREHFGFKSVALDIRPRAADADAFDCAVVIVSAGFEHPREGGLRAETRRGGGGCRPLVIAAVGVGVAVVVFHARGGDGDDDRLIDIAVLDCRAEGVFEQLGHDVLEMAGDVCELGIGHAIDDDGGADAVAEVADVADKVSAVADDAGRIEVGIDRADEGCRVRGARVGAGEGPAIVGEGIVVEGEVLLGEEAGADTGAEVLVEKVGDDLRGDVALALGEAAGEDGDGVAVGVDDLGEDVVEAGFLFEGGGEVVLGEGQQQAQGVQVVVVDLGDVGVRDDDVGEVAEGDDAAGEADGEDTQGEGGRGEELVRGQWGFAEADEVGEGERVQGQGGELDDLTDGVRDLTEGEPGEPPEDDDGDDGDDDDDWATGEDDAADDGDDNGRDEVARCEMAMRRRGEMTAERDEGRRQLQQRRAPRERAGAMATVSTAGNGSCGGRYLQMSSSSSSSCRGGGGGRESGDADVGFDWKV